MHIIMRKSSNIPEIVFGIFFKARGECGADLTSTESNDTGDATIDGPPAIQQDKQTESLTHNGLSINEFESESSLKSVSKESQVNMIADFFAEGVASGTPSCPDNSMVISGTPSLFVSCVYSWFSDLTSLWTSARSDGI